MNTLFENIVIEKGWRRLGFGVEMKFGDRIWNGETWDRVTVRRAVRRGDIVIRRQEHESRQ